MRNPQQPIQPALFAFEALSQYVSLNRTRIYAAIRAGTFPAPLKIGTSSRWQRSAIDAWIDQQAQAAQEAA
jgi:predicted DNA-binding transcriptional regulator AlpA